MKIKGITQTLHHYDKLDWSFWEIVYEIEYKTRSYRKKVEYKGYQDIEFDDDYEIYGEEGRKHVDTKIFKTVYHIERICFGQINKK